MQNQGNIFCPNCGGQNTTDNNFCLYCGISLTNLNQQQVQQPQQPQQPQQYNQYNQQNNQNLQYQNNQQNYQISQQQDIPQKEKKVEKLGFLGWIGIISLGYTSLGSYYVLIFAVILAILYFAKPNSKNGINIILKVIGAINITFLVLALILFGACIGIIGASGA